MYNILLGLKFIITGLVVVFLTLAVMSAAMWVTGRLLRGGRKKTLAQKPPLKGSGLDENEIAAAALAIHHYLSEKEGKTAEFEPLSRWKAHGRIESLERNT